MIALLYAAGSGIHRAARAPFWFDEIATLAIAQLDSPASIWQALRNQADAQPPTFYLVHAFARRMVSEPHIAYRLPSLAGFLAIPPALWILVRKRYSAPTALAAALTPFVLPLFTFYATEARPYALVTACVAWSLIAWQHADKVGRPTILALLLAAATSVSYTAVIAILPLAAAEAVRTWWVRQLRLAVWLAFGAGGIPVAAFWPLLSAFRREYGAAFWAKPDLVDAYGELAGLSQQWAAPLLFVVTSIVFAARAVTRRTRQIQPEQPVVPAEETVLILGLIGLPVVLFAAAVVSDGPMVSRYALPAVLGIAVATACATAHIAGRTGTWILVAAVIATGTLQQAGYWRTGQLAPPETTHDDVRILQRLTSQADTAGLPIVASNGLRFLPMGYYLAGASAPPVRYLADPEAAKQAIRTDSVDLAILRLAPYGIGQVEHPSTFFAAYRSFLVFSENEGWDYLPRQLIRAGHSVRILAVSGEHMLLRVDLLDVQSSDK